jgi:hypothetical protein
LTSPSLPRSAKAAGAKAEGGHRAQKGCFHFHCSHSLLVLFGLGLPPVVPAGLVVVKMAGDQPAGLDLAQVGFSTRQRSMTFGQRVQKLQPLGGLAGEGTSPFRMMRAGARPISGSGSFTADSSASA